MVVDDEEELLEIIEFELHELGYKVATVESGDQALDLISKDNFDFVLSDVRMRGLSGIDLVKKTNELEFSVPILLMSGFSEISEMEARKIGAVGIISKPLDFKKIVEFIEKIE